MKQEKPFFSIIVPTFNRPAQLAACLESLACLDYPLGRFEVIVSDDGSQTRLETLVASFSNRLDIVLAHQTHSGPAIARNKGAAQAKGDLLAFTDDDCTPAADWLKTLAARFTETPDVMIGGRTLNVLLDNPYSTASDLLIRYLYAYYNRNPDQAGFFTSNNLTVPKGGSCPTWMARVAKPAGLFCLDMMSFCGALSIQSLSISLRSAAIS